MGRRRQGRPRKHASKRARRLELEEAQNDADLYVVLYNPHSPPHDQQTVAGQSDARDDDDEDDVGGGGDGGEEEQEAVEVDYPPNDPVVVHDRDATENSAHPTLDLNDVQESHDDAPVTGAVPDNHGEDASRAVWSDTLVFPDDPVSSGDERDTDEGYPPYRAAKRRAVSADDEDEDGVGDGDDGDDGDEIQGGYVAPDEQSVQRVFRPPPASPLFRTRPFVESLASPPPDNRIDVERTRDGQTVNSLLPHIGSNGTLVVWRRKAPDTSFGDDMFDQNQGDGDDDGFQQEWAEVLTAKRRAHARKWDMRRMDGTGDVCGWWQVRDAVSRWLVAPDVVVTSSTDAPNAQTLQGLLDTGKALTIEHSWLFARCHEWLDGPMPRDAMHGVYLWSRVCQLQTYEGPCGTLGTAMAIAIRPHL